MWGHTVYKIADDGSRSVVADVPGRPSGLGFLPDNTPLVVSMADRCIYKIIDGELSLHADLSASVRADINDMLVDERGRAYVGNFGFDLFGGADLEQGEIILVDTDGGHRIVADKLDFPNGMVIKDNGRTLVVAESFGYRLSAFDRAEDGSLSNRRVYAELGELTPDGICLDTDGGIWAAGVMAGKFVRVGEDGRIVAEIYGGQPAAIACQLGGVDGKTLYCLTYSGTLEDIGKGIPGARIETVKVETGGAGSP
jgi:sugar lactone lactonase YvrE